MDNNTLSDFTEEGAIFEKVVEKEETKQDLDTVSNENTPVVEATEDKEADSSKIEENESENK